MQIDSVQLASQIGAPAETLEPNPDLGSARADAPADPHGLPMDASVLQQAIARRRAEIVRLESELGQRRREIGALVAALTVLQGVPGGKSARSTADQSLTAAGEEANRNRTQLKTAVRKALRKAMLAGAQPGEGFTAKYIAGLVKVLHPRTDFEASVTAVAACLQEYAAEGSLELIQSGRGPAQTLYRNKRR